MHLSQALLAHLFSYNITWGATKKEVERSNFWLEIPKIAKRFWLSFVISLVLIAAMVVLSTPLVPDAWQVLDDNWAVIFPLAIVVGCHILFPVSSWWSLWAVEYTWLIESMRSRRLCSTPG